MLGDSLALTKHEHHWSQCSSATLLLRWLWGPGRLLTTPVTEKWRGHPVMGAQTFTLESS